MTPNNGDKLVLQLFEPQLEHSSDTGNRDYYEKIAKAPSSHILALRLYASGGIQPVIVPGKGKLGLVGTQGETIDKIREACKNLQIELVSKTEDATLLLKGKLLKDDQNIINQFSGPVLTTDQWTAIIKNSEAGGE